jgi:hypothetical protein
MLWLSSMCSQVCQMSKSESQEPATKYYRRTTLKRAIGLTAWVTDVSVAPPTDAVPASITHNRATCPRALNSQRSSSNRWTRPSLVRPRLCRPDRCSPERVEDHPQANGRVCRDAIRCCPASIATDPVELLRRRPIDVDHACLSLTHPRVCRLLTESRGKCCPTDARASVCCP